MGLKVTGSPTSAERPAYPAVDIIDFFKTRSALVVAAVAALDAMPAALAALRSLVVGPDLSRLSHAFENLEVLVKSAAIGADNLLVADTASVDKPFVMCAVNRQPSGAVDVRTIELDRDALALGGTPRGPTSRPFDRLAVAIQGLLSEAGSAAIEAAAAAADGLSAQVRTSVSRLSIIKARLDLQQSFLSSVLEADTPTPLVRLDSHLNQAGARDMALEARRLLSGTRSLNIASGNRKTLASLFESLAAENLFADTPPEKAEVTGCLESAALSSNAPMSKMLGSAAVD